MSNPVNLDLGPWPTDPSKQSIYVSQLLSKIDELDIYLGARTADIIVLNQASEPTQAEFELAWAVQTNKALPVSKGAVFYWWDSVNDVLAGSYGLLLTDDEILRKDPKYVRGGIAVLDSSIELVAASSVSYAIGENISDHPALTFTNVQPVKLELTYFLSLTFVSGTGIIAVDFLLDGVKQGTVLHAIATDQGIYSAANTVDGITAFLLTAEVEPGEHTVQVIAGVAGSDPTPPVVTFEAARTLYVKGYAL